MTTAVGGGILTSLGFLVGVQGFKPAPASSSGARQLLLLLLRSSLLVVRVWLLFRLMAALPHTTPLIRHSL